MISETEAWWGGSQPCGEDDYDPEIAVSDAEVCPAPDHAVDCGRHAIPVSPATDPPIPIARVQRGQHPQEQDSKLLQRVGGRIC